MVPPYSTRVSRAPAYSLASSNYKNSCTGLLPPMVLLPSSFHFPVTPYNARALPISLATTLRISVDFFSSGYLDVSVPRVRPAYLCIQHAVTLAGRVSPFRYLRINACCQLPGAFRRLPRLSSPSTAKAFTLCA